MPKALTVAYPGVRDVGPRMAAGSTCRHSKGRTYGEGSTYWRPAERDYGAHGEAGRGR